MNIFISTLKQIRYVISVLSSAYKTPYIGWVGNKNLGDEILFKAHLKLFSQLKLHVFTESKILNIFYGINVPHSGTNFALLGGGTLINNSDHWLNQVDYMLQNHFIMFCIGAGVDITPDSKYAKDWFRVLSHFHTIGVRGPYSQKLLENIGIQNSIIVGDSAITLAEDTFSKTPHNSTVGINYGVNQHQKIFGSKENYTSNMVSIIHKLIESGFTVKLLPVFEADVESNIKLLQLINDTRCTLHIKFDNLEAYSLELKACDVFIGQKLHSTIMACMNRIPSIMIEYELKCRDFMASIDMEEFTVKTSEIDPKIVLQLVEKLIKNSDIIQLKLNQKILMYKEKQRKLAVNLKKQIGII